MSIEMRDAFFGKVYELACRDPRIVIVANDLGAPSLDRFRSEFPANFINAGISEQNIISVAAGLAMGGKRVCVYSIASFITLRCLEQIKIDLCVMDLPVTIAAVGPCYAYAVDGPTHHASEDIAIMRTLANMRILSPCDARGASAMAATVIDNIGPAYIRLDRGPLPEVYDESASFEPGFAVLQKGADLCIAATGIMTHRALDVAQTLGRQGIRASVVDVYRIKPLPPGIVSELSASARLVTIEEHTLHGGLGSMLLESCCDAGKNIPTLRLGIPDDRLYAYGHRETLQAACGLDRDAIVRSILSWL